MQGNLLFFTLVIGSVLVTTSCFTGIYFERHFSELWQSFQNVGWWTSEKCFQEKRRKETIVK